MSNITKVYLLSVPLEKDYVHTLYFSSRDAQQTYFYGKKKKEYTDFTYQRKDSVIRVPDHIDNLYSSGVNYVMYQNSAYSNKWFYAFIEDMKYINDERTDITIKTDCIQSWMFDISIKPSFVEREHARSDEIGEHTIEEGLETGEFVIKKSNTLPYGAAYNVVVAATTDSEGTGWQGGVYNGIYSGMALYAFDANSITSINDFVDEYTENGCLHS